MAADLTERFTLLDCLTGEARRDALDGEIDDGVLVVALAGANEKNHYLRLDTWNEIAPFVDEWPANGIALRLLRFEVGVYTRTGNVRGDLDQMPVARTTLFAGRRIE